MEDEIDLSQLFGTLWRGKIWIVLSGLVFLAFGIWYAFTVAVPLYTSNATGALESREQNVMDSESVVAGLPGDLSSINTEVEVLRSRTLIERVVLDLNLVDDPEFNSRLREPPAFSIGMAIDFIREQISGPKPEPVKPEPSERTILDSVMTSVLGAINISNVRHSAVFRINVVTQSPDKSANIANHLAELYINDQIRVKLEKTEQATKWLSERVVELQISLEKAEEELKSFSSKTDLVSPEGLIALSRQLKEFRERRDALLNSVINQDALITGLQDSLAAAEYDDFATLANNQLLLRLRQSSQGSEQDKRTLFEEQAMIVLEKKRLDAQRSRRQLAAIERSITEANMRIDQQSSELVRLQQLQRETEASRLIYEAFLSRLKETSIQQGIQQADSRILSKAVVPRGPSAPRKSSILALSLLFGLFLGSGYVLAREMSQTGIRTSEELERLTGKTVMGQIPMIPVRKRKRVLRYLIEKPNSAAAEAIRNLRTSALLSNVDDPPKVIMSTSSLPGEGKTTQSLALTQNFAGLGKKVLLIEGDIRRRVFSQYFDIKEDFGLLSVLSGKATLEEAAVFNEELGADVLIGEKSSTNAADVFSSKKFSDFLKKARETYDAVIIDTPPVLVVPDARVIGQSVDAILYTVKWDHTTRTQVREGLRMFETVNLKVTGLVLAQIDAKGMKRYGYGGEYGAYSAYGAKYYHN